MTIWYFFFAYYTEKGVMDFESGFHSNAVSKAAQKN